MFQRLTDNRLSLSTFCSRQLTYWRCFWTSMNIMLHNPSRIVCVHLRWFLLLDTVKSNHLQMKSHTHCWACWAWWHMPDILPVLTHKAGAGAWVRTSVGYLLSVLKGQGWWCRSSASYLMDFIFFLMSLKTQIKINGFHILIKTAVKSHEVMLQFIVAS